MFKYFKKPRFKIKCWNFQVCLRKQVDSANSLKLGSCSTPPICRGLRISEFKSNFLGIREYVFGPSFLLTLNILKDCFNSRQTVHKLHKHWANSVLANYDLKRSSWPNSSLSLEKVAVYLQRRVLWPSIFLTFIMWMNWRTLQPTIFLVGDWSHVLGSAQLVSHVLGIRTSEREIVTTEQVQLGIGVRVQL